MCQQNLPQADKGVNFLRSTMSGLENTPPPGDRPGSHSLIYFLKEELLHVNATRTASRRP